MKKIGSILMMAVLFLTSCEKDNYDAPDAFLRGKVVYNGETLKLKNGEVSFRAYEPGWDYSSSTFVDIKVAQDGTFSANLFSGKTYKLIRMANVGPWENPTAADTIVIEMKGDTNLDMPVVPFFTISNPVASINGSIASASLKINKISTNKNIEKVGLYLSSNVILDANINSRGIEVGGASLTDLSNVALTFDLREGKPEEIAAGAKLLKESYIFARVGIKTEGVGAMIYSDPIKINLQ